jgi:hypothetical protein
VFQDLASIYVQKESVHKILQVNGPEELVLFLIEQKIMAIVRYHNNFFSHTVALLSFGDSSSWLQKVNFILS